MELWIDDGGAYGRSLEGETLIDDSGLAVLNYAELALAPSRMGHKLFSFLVVSVRIARGGHNATGKNVCPVRSTLWATATQGRARRFDHRSFCCILPTLPFAVLYRSVAVQPSARVLFTTGRPSTEKA